VNHMNTQSHLLEMLAPLKSYHPKELHVREMRTSAVLIPIVNRQNNQLVFTLRSQNLTHHPGQISFPGGRIEENETSWDAAVREAEEEIGLPPTSVRNLGQLDDVYSPRGFHIQCFAGLVEEFQPVLNEQEVERLVCVDLDELFDDNLHEVKPWHGYSVHYFNFKEGLVWGVTGQITYFLRQALRP